MSLLFKCSAIASLVALTSATALAGGSSKVDLCHANGAGSYNIINVSSSAQAAHLAHGDALPGSWYEDLDGDGYGDPDSTASRCPDAGTVDNALDCDDGNSLTWPGAEEIEDGADNDCDGWADEGWSCPCFDEDDLDDYFAGWSLTARYWSKRPSGTTNELSLQGWTWVYDGSWSAPTIGADIYRVTAEGGAPYCETWSQTWLASGINAWDDDYVGESYAIAEEDYETCDGMMRGWAADAGLSITSW